MFDPTDVKRLAIAVLNSWSVIDEGGKNAYLHCKYCNKSRYINWNEPMPEVEHKVDCLVLVAKDVLT